MKKHLFISVLVIILSFYHSNILAQVKTDTAKVERPSVIKMIDGDEYVGKIIREDSTSIILKTSNADIIISKSNIKNIEAYTYSGKFKFPNLNDTRYFFGPSAIPIKKGKGYYQNIEVALNFVNYGITNNISIGGGFEFLSLTQGYPVVFLTPKIGFKITEKFHLGGGVLYGSMLGENSRIGLPYVVSTFGTAENNITFGGGVLVSGEDVHAPTIMLSGTSRVNDNIALLTESYLVIIDGTPMYLGIHGIRIISRKNSFDIGLILVQELGFPLPFIGYVRNF